MAMEVFVTIEKRRSGYYQTPLLINDLLCRADHLQTV